MIRSFLADADFKRAIVHGLLRRNHEADFRTAEEVPLEGLPDPAVLLVAADQNRILVSPDMNTMPGHFREFVRHKQSPGLILIPQNLSIGRAVESLVLISEACVPEDFTNRLCLVPSLTFYGF